MTEAISRISRTLESLYPAHEIRSLTGIVLSHVTGLSRYQLLSCKDKQLSVTESAKLNEILSRLMQSEPIQYILGECEFYNLSFEVNPSTLIPRPETEELVECIVKNHSGQYFHILDIGTGTGCIAITLAKYLPGSVIEALDISPEALQTAEKNAAKNGVSVRFMQGDILNKDTHTLLRKEYDILVSNPPYVTEREKEDMEQNVLNYEPHTALFVKDNDPLLFYREIAELGLTHLKAGGFLYFEINRQYGEETIKLLESKGYTGIVKQKDLFGNDRIIKAQK